MPIRSILKQQPAYRENYLFHFADAILELGNLGFSVLTLGQAFHEELNFILLTGGIVFLFTAYFVAYTIIKKEGVKKR